VIKPASQEEGALPRTLESGTGFAGASERTFPRCFTAFALLTSFNMTATARQRQKIQKLSHNDTTAAAVLLSYLRHTTLVSCPVHDLTKSDACSVILNEVSNANEAKNLGQLHALAESRYRFLRPRGALLSRNVLAGYHASCCSRIERPLRASGGERFRPRLRIQVWCRLE
jgi:hypothetical protein